MKNFMTKPGVNSFETGGPEGLVRVDAGSPLSTDDPAVISLLETHGAHALESRDAVPAGRDAQKKSGDDR